MGIKAKLNTWGNRPKPIPSRTDRRIAGVLVDWEKAAAYNRPFVVCGLSVSWNVIEHAAAVHEGREKPEGITRDEAFCEACSELYSREEKRLTDYNAGRGLNKEGEPLNNQKGEVKAMKHTNFKGYLDDAKKVKEKAMISYDEITQTWEDEKRAWDKAQHSGLSERDMLLAKADYMRAEDDYKNGMAGLMEGTKATLAEIRKEMKQHTDDFYRADPAKLDTNTLTLINSGILSTEELSFLAEKNRGNVTMLRMIGAEAKKRIDAAHANKESWPPELSVLHNKLQGMGGGKRELEAFDTASEWITRCINPEPAFSKANNAHFDRIFEDIYSRMDGITAQPETGTAQE